MTRHYCTYFDHHYMPYGLAMVESLLRWEPDAIVWVLCLDEATQRFLRTLPAPIVRTISLSELEEHDPELAQTRANRSRVEYIFTLSPCLPRFLFQQYPDIRLLTYVDADFYFFSSPEPVFEELGTGSVLITPHDFPPWLEDLNRTGRYNVGVLSFRRSSEAMSCLEWWRDRCLEWCYDKVEPGRYADQKYLDEWPHRFSSVRVCGHPGVNAAPWNWMNRRWSRHDRQLLVNGLPLVAFHFSSLRRRSRRRVDPHQLTYGVMPFRLRNRLYRPYLEAVDCWTDKVSEQLAVQTREQPVQRFTRSRLRSLLAEVLFGAVWTRHASYWFAWSLGLGRWSARVLRRFGAT